VAGQRRKTIGRELDRISGEGGVINDEVLKMRKFEEAGGAWDLLKVSMQVV
jgi:hypothetical protein